MRSRLTPINKPHCVFGGKNIMTPDVLGYFKLRRGLGYAELSEGEGFVHEAIYGVTIRPDPTHGLSQMFHSRSKAESYIESLS